MNENKSHKNYPLQNLKISQNKEGIKYYNLVAAVT